MKRFLVFGFDSYYPDGGWEDFKGHADTLEAAWGVARLAHIVYNCDHWQIVDAEACAIVATGKGDEHDWNQIAETTE